MKPCKSWNKEHQTLNFSSIALGFWWVFCFVFMWFARFQILICEQQSIWSKLLLLSQLYFIFKFKLCCHWLKLLLTDQISIMLLYTGATDARRKANGLNLSPLTSPGDLCRLPTIRVLFEISGTFWDRSDQKYPPL